MRKIYPILMIILGFWGFWGCAQGLAPSASQQESPAPASPEDNSQPAPPDVAAVPDSSNADKTGPNTVANTIAMTSPGNPIEPRSDDAAVEGNTLRVAYRARYGANFSQTVPQDPNQASWPLERDGTLNLDIVCESNFMSAGWGRCGTELKVRLVFTPDGKTSSDGSFYDVDVKSTDDATANVTFDGLKLGSGTVSLYAYEGNYSIGGSHLLGSFTLSPPLPEEIKALPYRGLPYRIRTPAAIRNAYQSAP